METLKQLLHQAHYKRWVLSLVVSLVVGVIVSVDWGYLTCKPVAVTAPRYLVTRRKLPAGLPVSFRDFTLTSNLPKFEQRPNVVTDQDIEILRGAVLQKGMERSEVLLVDHLSHDGIPIPPGYRAYSIAFEQASDVRGGDSIDIFLIPTDVSQEPSLILEGAVVLAPHTEGKGELVRLALSLPQIEIVEEARKRGKLALAVRGQQDRIDTPRVVQRAKKKFVAPRIEMIEE